MTETSRRAVPRFAIALTSLTALAYEVLLMRMFSIIQWHHFAYMIISVALLGYGISGTFLALTQRRLLRHFGGAFVANVALFGATSVACFLGAQRVAFHPEQLLWDPAQPWALALIYLFLTLPFFFAANAVALALAYHRDRISTVYAADLIGAGLGSVAVIGLLFVLFPGNALRALGALGLVTAAVGWWELGLHPRREGLAFVFGALVLLGLPPSWTDPQLSPYKPLTQALEVSGTRVTAERSSPLGLLSVVESPQIPFRHAPGLSINADATPPEQRAVFTDGGAMSVVDKHTGRRGDLAYLDQLTSALPYHLGPAERVLVLGAGGGTDVRQARYHGVPRIDAVDLNPQVIDLVRGPLADFSGDLYGQQGVRVYAAEARGFVAGTPEHYDVIQLSLLDAFGASASGLYALSESYIYTVEALEQYIAHLQPGGYLTLTRWVKLPPRDNLKLFATAIAALENRGVAQPGQRLVLIRGWQTATLVVKNGDFTDEEIQALRAFCRSRAFDPAWYPGMPAEEANRRNVLARPYLYNGARALLGPERDTFLRAYKFNIDPATDDRPYFFRFFKWRTLPELLALGGQGARPLLEWGYLVPVATLMQALAASLVLILLPLHFVRARGEQTTAGVSRLRVLVYFFVVGLAFLFLEIAFIQKFILFLHHPLYAAGVVLAGFLVFAGLGSAWSRRAARRERHFRTMAGAVLGIVVLGTLYILGLGPLFDGLAHWPTVARVAVSVALLAPLAFAMGMPFPLALSVLGRYAPVQIPWAWGVNGCASVISAVLASLLAIHFGFTVVVALALALYGVAGTSFPRARAV